MIGFSHASDWLRGWCQFPRPITERSNAHTLQSRITFDTRLKIALEDWIFYEIAFNLKETSKYKFGKIEKHQKGNNKARRNKVG